MRLQALSMALIAASFTVGCAGTYDYAVAGSDGPDLVYAAPGVQVIADYDEPIFYSGGLYWRYDGGSWYRSSYYTGGWASAQPPTAIVRIDRPHEYVRYRPASWVARGPARPARIVSEPRRVEPIREPARASVLVTPPPVAPSHVAPQPQPQPQPQPVLTRRPVPVVAPRAAPPRRGEGDPHHGR